jgi:RsiW-degrading membrane proteinase PrsW (M82 family)
MAGNMITEFIILLILGLAPSFVWLRFYLKEDPHPEPKRWLASAFIAGGGAVLLAFLAQKAMVRYFNLPQDIFQEEALSPTIFFLFIGVALIEEIAKFAAGLTILWKNPVFDEPVDAMIYMIVIALGFAAMENIVLLANLDRAALISEGLPAIILRMIGANFLHTLASGILGFGWALSLIARRPTTKFFTFFVIGLGGATALHSAFNLLIIKLGASYLFPVTFLLFTVGLLVLHEFDILKRLKLTT